MPLFGRKRGNPVAAEPAPPPAAAGKPKKQKKPAAVAHFVSPRSQLAAAKRGEKVMSVCGEARITGDPVPGAPICQECVLSQLQVDDKKTDERVRSRYEEGLATGEQRGVAKGRADTMNEIREAAERRARELQSA